LLSIHNYYSRHDQGNIKTIQAQTFGTLTTDCAEQDTDEAEENNDTE
jgi:hypothetical protein